ncbi:(3R)-hydroxymyristoyl ACP dehydratase [Synechococcus sp. BL107]|nr:(3R)-hydroxymyristoyl ACP dehydratase [Synechococcus sp. BL107]
MQESAHADPGQWTPQGSCINALLLAKAHGCEPAPKPQP